MIQTIIKPLVTGSFVCLSLQAPNPFVQFVDQIPYPVQVRLCTGQFSKSLPSSDLVLGNASGLFEHVPSIISTVRKDILDHLEFDDRVSTSTHSRIHEQIGDIFEPTLNTIQKVLGFTAAEKPTPDGDLTVFNGKNTAIIFDGEQNLGHAQ